VEIHQQCMDKFPEEMLSYPQRADCYRDINRLLVSAGRVQEAKSLIRDIKIPPKDLHLRIFRAGLLRDVSESQQAFADYSQVLTASPQLAEAWSRRAFAHFDLQQWEPAIADFSKAIELDPEVHTNWWHRGHSYIALGQWDKAAADFTTVTEKWPLDSETWYLLGLTHAQLRRPDQALADLRQAVAKGFKDAERMKADLNLQTLRDNHDFKELLSELDKKANPALTTRKSGS
jgi:tetratricopeptide (TPR) repeat protein